MLKLILTSAIVTRLDVYYSTDLANQLNLLTIINLKYNKLMFL